MRILSIETSCDDSAISILDAKGKGHTSRFKLLANFVSSQTEIHSKYGGVFPMMAKRAHARNLVPLLSKAIKKAGLEVKMNYQMIDKKTETKIEKILDREKDLYTILIEYLRQIKKPKIDMISVTKGPGLEPTLWVGINLARALSLAWNIPIMPVNHMEGHLLSSLYDKKSLDGKIKKINFPAIALLVSGGHTEIVLMNDWGKYKVIGKTRDDAVGEAFDKVARMLGLPYPGGPYISKLAESGKIDTRIKFPRPMITTKDLDFSFSGLKTAVLYLVRDLGEIDEQTKANIAKEFENSALEVLVTKTKKAIEMYGAKTLLIGGGVSANSKLRKELEKVSIKFDALIYHFPSRELSTDNSIMIAMASYFKYIFGKNKIPKIAPKIKAEGNLRF